MAGPRRRPAPRGRGRAARARRPQGPVLGAAGRPERRLRDPAAGARVDALRARLAEAAPDRAQRPRDPGAGRLQLRAGAERLLGRSGRPRRRAARAAGRRCRRLSGAGRLPGLALVSAPRARGPRDRRGPAPVRPAPGLRRARGQHRAAGHRGRRGAPVPARADPGRHQRRRPGGAERRAGRPGSGRAEPPGRPRHRDGRPARRRGWAGRDLGSGDRRLRPADPDRGLAARPDGRVGRLRAHRPADRRPRARGRPEPRRRRP